MKTTYHDHTDNSITENPYKIIGFRCETLPEVNRHIPYSLIHVAIKSGIGWKAYKGLILIDDEIPYDNLNHPALQQVAAYGRKISKIAAANISEFTFGIDEYEE